jgi:hypothetical protein
VKYFTPDLIVRGQSEDDRVLNEVEALWDERCQRYNSHLASLRDELCPGLRHIEDHYYLHDARVRGMGQRDGAFVIVLRLDTPPHSLLTFRYEVVEPPRIDRDVLPESVRSGGDSADWLYDEIEKVPGEPPTWRQSILLSNGWEIGIHFRDVKVEEMQAVLPAPINGAVLLPVTGLPPPV